jgi:DNA-binding NarL/FixJ family response regulator
MEIRVAIVEDSPGIREQWSRLVEESPGFRLVCACGDAEAALRDLPLRRPDVVLMDINLPGMSGIECTARLRVAMPQVRILMVTVYDDNDRIFKALQAGASGYLLKRSSGEQLLHAITEVMEGGGPMSGEIARRVIQSFQRPTPTVEPDVELTAREREVLDWVARGFATKEIADRLGISARTVSLHLQHIYGKLHVRSRTEAALKYLAAGGVAAAARSI